MHRHQNIIFWAGCALLIILTSGCKSLHGVASVPLHYPTDSQERLAADFLTKNLPSSDRVTITSENLIENITYAFKARKEMPWGKTVPFDIFQHYVLPHRLINEPFKPYRKQLYEQLVPLVRKSGTILEAAIRINLWCASQVEYRPSSFWLTAPADMQKVGFGRCEELAIFFAAAARSIGIPVRGCWVPAWRHTDDNHVWVEIWDNGKWIPLEAASTIIDPNKNWFLGPARSVPAIYSPVYGHIRSTEDEPVYRHGAGYTTLNLTKRYAEVNEFRIKCTGRDGSPIANQQVLMWTINDNAPALVARQFTNMKGSCVILLGKGTYIASTGDGKEAMAKLARAKTSISFKQGDRLGDSWTWTLNHPPSRPAQPQYPVLTGKLETTIQQIAIAASNDREANKTSAHKASASILKTTDATLSASRKALAAPWPSAIRLTQEYIPLSQEDKKLLDSFIQFVNPKDLALISLQELVDHVKKLQQAITTNNQAPIDIPSQYSTLFSPRVYREPFSLCLPLYKNGIATHEKKGKMAHEKIIREAFASPKIEQTPFVTPLQVASGNHGTHEDKLTQIVALFRSTGIAARFLPEISGVAYQKNAKWKQIAPKSNPLSCFTIKQLEVADSNSLIVAFDCYGNFLPTQLTPKEQTNCLPRSRLFNIRTKRSPTKISVSFTEK